MHKAYQSRVCLKLFMLEHFLKPLIFTHGHINNTYVSPIKPRPAACCCCPDTSRAARVSLLASSKSAAWSLVKTMRLAAGSSTSAGLRWHEDIWPRSIFGSGCQGKTALSAAPILQPCFMSWVFTRVCPYTGTVVQSPFYSFPKHHIKFI